MVALGKPTAHTSPGGEACRGWFQSTSADDWKECSNCGATGTTDGAACSHCHGDGWIYSTRS